MKKLVIILALALGAINASYAQSYERNGKTFVQVSSKSNKSNDVATTYKWKDSKGNEYPIYLSSNGRAFVKRVSKNGNEYKQYLGEEISRTICKELNREYK